MIARIRYKKVDNTLESIRNIVTPRGCVYHVVLDLDTMTFNIKNLVSKRVYSGGENINNLHVLKRSVKSRLKKLGVQFKSEIREVNN